jgi:hypothetical protein
LCWARKSLLPGFPPACRNRTWGNQFKCSSVPWFGAAIRH